MDIKIVQINSLDNAGGAAKVAYLLHEKYKSLGLSSKILCGIKTSDDKDVSLIKGRYTSKFISKILDKYKLRDWVGVRNPKLFTMAEYKDADIVHLHNIHQGFFDINNLPKITKQKKVVWTLHDMWAITGNSYHTYGCERWDSENGMKCTCSEKHNKIFLYAEKEKLKQKQKIYNNSDMVIVSPSQWLADMVKRSVLKDKRIEVIPNGIDHKNFSGLDKLSLRTELNLPHGKKIICFNAHGGLKNKWKGGQYLLDAVDLISKQKDVVLLELGCNIQQREEIGNRIRIPYMDNYQLLYKYMEACDLFLFTSLAENFPLVVIEALGAGLPVVSFDVGGVKEIAKHEENGYIARYKDIDDLVYGALMILNSEQLSNEISANNKKRFLSEFTLETEAERYLKLYIELLSK